MANRAAPSVLQQMPPAAETGPTSVPTRHFAPRPLQPNDHADTETPPAPARAAAQAGHAPPVPDSSEHEAEHSIDYANPAKRVRDEPSPFPPSSGQELGAGEFRNLVGARPSPVWPGETIGELHSATQDLAVADLLAPSGHACGRSEQSSGGEEDSARAPTGDAHAEFAPKPASPTEPGRR